MSKSLEELEALAAEGKNKVPIRENKFQPPILPIHKPEKKCEHGVFNCNLTHEEHSDSFWWMGVGVFIVAGGYLWLLHLLRSS